GIPRPRGLAFNASGNPFAAISALVDDHFVGKVVTFNPQRKPTPIGAASFSVFQGVAIDPLGNVYVMAQPPEVAFTNTIFKYVPGVSRSVFGTVPGQGFGLAFDSAGHLYAADAVEATIYKFTPD